MVLNLLKIKPFAANRVSNVIHTVNLMAVFMVIVIAIFMVMIMIIVIAIFMVMTMMITTRRE